ncbi:hypothetical protein OKJ48_17920 [Streptomyces kunmingensis]|uniref:Uncharacterized protein n=1 Tax=Streptomyces kunmingensis TaxID=68225 RepID=A0ABU6CBW9_9ACTN|nr:hypothetical protein [Streptomyces kunmingensis]MEB3962112.1 hypothetical protein [Streptomyces kunmingensis]
MGVTQGYGQQGGPVGGFGAPPPMFGPPVVAGGPEFVAADEFNGLVVDPEGVHFEMGPHGIELPWSRLRTVQFHPLDGGLSVSAVTVDGPVYECRVRARRRAQVGRWCTELAGVLHHYLGARG